MALDLPKIVFQVHGVDAPRKAVQLDGSDSYAHTFLAFGYRHSSMHDRAIDEAEMAVQLGTGSRR